MLDPSECQTSEQISRYYLNAKVGDLAVIRDVYWGGLQFTNTTIENIKPPRLYVADAPAYTGPAFYIKTGMNCRSPHGKASLVAPSLEIEEWQKLHRDGIHRTDFIVSEPSGANWMPRAIADKKDTETGERPVNKTIKLSE